MKGSTINRSILLAMPVSWKGTLQQYTGRQHRDHATRTDVRIIYFIDTGHRAMSYRMAEEVGKN